MRIVVRLDAESVPVEVRPDLTEVGVGERTFPVQVVHAGPTKVELEIGGERVVVEGWPEGPSIPTEVILDGERFSLGLDVARETVARSPRWTAETPVLASAPGAEGNGVAVVPPMPGRVVEVRVHDGESVTRGQVLLVVEAMKMRNEVASPRDGVVRRLKVTAGSSVRAREPMLWIEPA